MVGAGFVNLVYAETSIILAGTGREPAPATSHQIRRSRTLILQLHLHQNNQPSQGPLPQDRSLIEPRKLPRGPLGHIDGERLHEAQRHIDRVGGKGELEVPERADDRLGREAVGQLARFDLQGDDGVEVFEFGGGEGARDQGGRLDEGGDFDSGGLGRGWDGACSYGGGGRGGRCLTLEVSPCGWGGGQRVLRCRGRL